MCDLDPAGDLVFCAYQFEKGAFILSFCKMFIFERIEKMKNTKRILALLAAVLMVFSLAACTQTETPQNSGDTSDSSIVTDGTGEELTGVWKDAVYTEDKSFGEGAKTITVKVVADDRSVTFTIKTDKDTLGAALLDNGIVEGEQGAYGLYIKKVNGMLADYNVDQSYWSISKSGVDLMTGADGENISGGENYELTRKK